MRLHGGSRLQVELAVGKAGEQFKIGAPGTGTVAVLPLCVCHLMSSSLAACCRMHQERAY